MGVSTRAFAESAWRAGFTCETVDAFGDLDQNARVRNVSFHRDLRRRYSARAAAAVSRRLAPRAAAYVGNLENHPAAVRRLAADRLLLGNTPDVLARARDPVLLARVVATAGARTPLTLRPCDGWRADVGRRWLRKPIRGGGGSGVRPWRPGDPLHPYEIVQEYVEGVPASMVFIADGQRAALLGLSRQLTDRALPFRYAGSLYPLCWPSVEYRDPAAHASLEDRAAAVATAVTVAFGLRGINGLDFVLHDGELYVLELNPRYPASAELIERATGLSIFEAHVDACLGDFRAPRSELPAVSAPVDASGVAHPPLVPSDEPETQRATRTGRTPSVWGKAIIYARHDVVMGDTSTLLDDDAFRDVPFPGERIRRGQPICTVFASGESHATCRVRLADVKQIVELLGSTAARGESTARPDPAPSREPGSRVSRGLRTRRNARRFPIDSEPQIGEC